MIAYGICWPSIQEASEILRRRIATEFRVRELRRQLEAQFEKRAA